MLAALMILLANKVAYWEQRENNLLFERCLSLQINAVSFGIRKVSQYQLFTILKNINPSYLARITFILQFNTVMLNSYDLLLIFFFRPPFLGARGLDPAVVNVRHWNRDHSRHIGYWIQNLFVILFLIRSKNSLVL